MAENPYDFIRDNTILREKTTGDLWQVSPARRNCVHCGGSAFPWGEHMLKTDGITEGKCLFGPGTYEAEAPTHGAMNVWLHCVATGTGLRGEVTLCARTVVQDFELAP